MHGDASEGFRRAALVTAGASLVIGAAYHLTKTSGWAGWQGVRTAALVLLTPLALFLLVRGIGAGIAASDRFFAGHRRWSVVVPVTALFAGWAVVVSVILALEGRGSDDIVAALGVAPITLIAAITSLAFYRHAPAIAAGMRTYTVPVLKVLAILFAVMAIVGGIGVGVVVAGKGDPVWGLLYALLGAGLAVLALAINRIILWVVEGFSGQHSQSTGA